MVQAALRVAEEEESHTTQAPYLQHEVSSPGDQLEAPLALAHRLARLAGAARHQRRRRRRRRRRLAPLVAVAMLTHAAAIAEHAATVPLGVDEAHGRPHQRELALPLPARRRVILQGAW